MGRVLSGLSSVPLAVFGSTSALTHDLMGADRVLRAPLPLSRRFGFVQLRGGSGASSTAAYVTSLLAKRRAGMVLGVNASAGENNLLWHAGLTSAALHTPSERRSHARSASDARDGLPVTGSGMFALDLRDARDAPAPASVRTWSDTLTPITRFYDVVSTDWGVRNWQVDLGQVAASSHVVCLVARADRHSAEEAAALVPALLDQEDRPRVVVALVDVGRTADRGAQVLRDRLGIPVVCVPYDPARASTRALSSPALAARTRIAYTRLATSLMREAQAPTDRRLAGQVSA